MHQKPKRKNLYGYWDCIVRFWICLPSNWAIWQIPNIWLDENNPPIRTVNQSHSGDNQSACLDKRMDKSGTVFERLTEEDPEPEMDKAGLIFMMTQDTLLLHYESDHYHYFEYNPSRLWTFLDTSTSKSGGNISQSIRVAPHFYSSLDWVSFLLLERSFVAFANYSWHPWIHRCFGLDNCSIWINHWLSDFMSKTPPWVSNMSWWMCYSSNPNSQLLCLLLLLPLLFFLCTKDFLDISSTQRSK